MQPQKRGPGYTSILSLLPCMVVLSGCAETQSSQTTSLGTAGTVGSAGSSGESSGGVGTGGSLGANAGGGLVGGGSGTGGEPGLSGSAGTSGTAGMGASGGLGGIGGIGNTAGQSGAAGTGTGGTGQSSLTASVLESGAIHSCAITSAGSPMCWGGNAWGELGDNSTTQGHIPVTVAGLISGASAISAGEYHTCVVTNSGGAMCWGGNDHGQLGEGSTTTSLVPVAVAGLSSGVTAISAGEKHTCAVTSSGGAMCWGGNVYSQLGDNSSADSLVPVAVADLSSGVTAISAGSFHTCVVLNTGGAMCWGGNYFGQLGDSSNTDRYAPVQVVGLSSDVKAISAGQVHTCALTSTGGVMCWGDNAAGQLGDGSGAISLVPVGVSGFLRAWWRVSLQTCSRRVFIGGHNKCNS